MRTTRTIWHSSAMGRRMQAYFPRADTHRRHPLDVALANGESAFHRGDSAILTVPSQSRQRQGGGKRVFAFLHRTPMMLRVADTFVTQR